MLSGVSNINRHFSALMYHHVGHPRSGANSALTISPERFERQMARLSTWGYVGIRASDLLHNRGPVSRLATKPIVITFDDAYADTSQFALPVLARYGFGATVFVVTRRIAQASVWDESLGYRSLPLMTADEILHWSGRGIEFGAHSRSHADLTTLSGTELEDEVAGSKDDLSSLLGMPVTSFAYPYGALNDSVYRLVRDHFDLAFTIQEGMNYVYGDPHRLRRAFVSPSASLIQFAINVRCGGGMKWWRDLRTKVGIRTRLKRAIEYFS